VVSPVTIGKHSSEAASGATAAVSVDPPVARVRSGTAAAFLAVVGNHLVIYLEAPPARRARVGDRRLGGVFHGRLVLQTDSELKRGLSDNALSAVEARSMRSARA